ncbi:MAG: endonuclease/exonuclease/phosphatase family protein [Actinomycetota bacterium]
MRRVRLSSALTASVLVATLLVAAPRTATAVAFASSSVKLRIMTFNIEYGGTVIDFGDIVTGVKRADADVVGVNEAYAHLRRLAVETGYQYWNHRLDVISRYPIVDPSAKGRRLFVEVAPGRVFAIANIHLPSAPYSPNLIRHGATRHEILSLERSVRVPAIRPFVQALAPLADAGMPTIILGDFNAPSFQDYTDRTVGTRPQIKWPIRWPVSSLLAGHGYRDTYRSVFPNPRAHPGITWPSDRPRTPDGWNPPPRSLRDRIDQIWVRNATALRSAIVGRPTDDDVTIAVRHWGSDHRAVVSTVRMTPTAPPVFVSADPVLVDRGAKVHVPFHAPGDGGERIALVPAGGDPSAAVASKAVGSTDGKLSFVTAGWNAGAYNALLVDASAHVLARYPFYVRRPGAPLTLATDRTRYPVGRAIEVTWRGAPGWRWDWIGIYKRGADPQVAYYLTWKYTGATVVGAATLDDSAPGTWPLKPGKYSVYYLRNDSYVKIGSTDFVVHR